MRGNISRFEFQIFLLTEEMDSHSYSRESEGSGDLLNAASIKPNKILFIFLFLGGMSNFSLKSNHLPPDTTKTTLMQLLIDIYH